MKRSAVASIVLAAFAASSTAASAAGSRPVSIHDFFQAIRSHDNRMVAANLSWVVTEQRDWDLATELASGAGNNAALAALFAMDAFHPRDSRRQILENFAIPGLYPKCSGLIGWALSNRQTDTALRLYGEPKCQDASQPLCPITVKHGTAKTKALTRRLPLAIVVAARQGWSLQLRMLLEAKRTAAAAEKDTDDEQLFLAVNQALLEASRAGHKFAVEELLADDDVAFNEYYEDAIAAAKAGNRREALIQLLASKKHPASAEFQADLKRLHAEEQEIARAALGLAEERVESRIAETRAALQRQERGAAVQSRPAYRAHH